MLIGEHQHNIDAKGRLFIPARFRADLGERFILTKGMDGCLNCYSYEGWQVLETRLRAQPMSKARNLQRFFFAGAAEMEVDKQGRILVPANLREYASLSHDVMIIGASQYVEIWDKQKWQNVCGSISDEMIVELMDEMNI